MHLKLNTYKHLNTFQYDFFKYLEKPEKLDLWLFTNFK